ncbi:MAG: hypothetical protein ACRDFS_02750 [Chloroflexota bacterium]
MRRSLLVAGTLGAAGLATSAGVGIAAHQHPSFRVVPHKVNIGRMATIKGSHFPAGNRFFFMLAVPNSKHPKAQALLPGTLKAGKHGVLQGRVRLPILTKCGKASIYAFKVRGKQSVRAGIILGGCKAPKHGHAPPPPPSKGT